MKKFSLIIAAGLLLSACGTAPLTSEDASNAAAGTGEQAPAEEVNEETVVTETEEAAEEEATEENATEDAEVTEPSGMELYMPEEGLVKHFEVDSFELVREVLEVKGNKVLETVTFGDVKTVQISEWTEDGIQMLFDNGDLEGIEDISIDGLQPTSAPVSMISESNSAEGEWLLTGTEETVTVPAGTFEDVIVIEQILKSDSTDQVTTLTHYYAQGLGFIKEKTAIQNGENVQESIIELVSYE